MSYILDALQRADAERERGATPGLHARHHLRPSSPTSKASPRRLWLIAATLALLALGSVAAWFWPLGRSAAPLAVSSQTAPSPAANPAPPPAPPSAPVRATADIALKQDAPPAVTAAAGNASAPLPPTPGPTAAANPAHRAPSATQPPATPASPSAAANRPVQAVKTPKAPEPRAPENRVATRNSGALEPPPAPMLQELPDDIRAQIPKITVTGSVYASAPAQRLLLVNNQVLNQGQTLAPELLLEEIQPKHAILNFRGTRFRVPH